MQIKHKVLRGFSWRAEARAAAMTPAGGARVRNCCGHLMRLARAYDCLPDTHLQAAILCFHGVDISPEPDVADSVLHVRDFRKLLRVLHRSFRVIGLAELVQCVRERRSVPDKSVVITFDDGYANNYTVAAEELARLHMPWSEFLPAGLIETGGRQWVDDVRILVHRGHRKKLSFQWNDQPIELDLTTAARRRDAVKTIIETCRYLPEELRQQRFEEFRSHYPQDELDTLRDRSPTFATMTWSQARELQAAGVDVGSHSLSHLALARQSPDRIRHEILAAQNLLQQHLGDHSPHFSYPYGRPACLSEVTEAILTEAGYACAVTLEQTLVQCKTHNLLALPRLIVSTQVGRTLFDLWQRFIQ